MRDLVASASRGRREGIAAEGKVVPHPPETWQIALRSLRIFLAMLSKRQAEAICQCLKGILGHLLRLLAKLAVEAGIIVSIHAALKNPSLH